VFDPLWQMHHARADAARTAGVWLGLAVIHRIIELHGGRIVVSSDGHSMGTVFTVRLPLAAAAQLPDGMAEKVGKDKVAPPLRIASKMRP